MQWIKDCWGYLAIGALIKVDSKEIIRVSDCYNIRVSDQKANSF